MKQLLFISLALVLALGMTSCNQDKIDQLERQKAMLEQEKSRQDSLLNDFMNTFNQFEDNLDMIKEKENLISMGSENPEYRTDNGKDRILEDIQMINALLDQNRQIIEELTTRAEQAEGTSSQYRRTIGRLKKQLEERSTEVASLKEALAAKNFEVDELNGTVALLTTANTDLNQANATQAARIDRQSDSLAYAEGVMSDQDVALNTAYYITGTTRELKDQQVISKEGGFIGIGRTKKLAEDFNAEAFNTIDIREMTAIPIATKKAELLTTHPSGSYTFKDTDDDRRYDILEITNPEEFWKTSRYLVVMVD